MRWVRYNVAATLDGFLAGPGGEFDGIPHDDTVDFGALFANVDTVLMGRVSYEVALSVPERPWNPGTRVYGFSTTLKPEEHPEVTVVPGDAAGLAAKLRAEEGTGDIWLFGGGGLFAELLAAGQVDAVEVYVCPVLLGGGIPLLPSIDRRTMLTLTHSRVHPSGIVGLHYEVVR